MKWMIKIWYYQLIMMNHKMDDKTFITHIKLLVKLTHNQTLDLHEHNVDPKYYGEHIIINSI